MYYLICKYDNNVNVLLLFTLKVVILPEKIKVVLLKKNCFTYVQVFLDIKPIKHSELPSS